MRKKKLFLFLALGVFVVLVVAIGLIIVLRDPVIRAQYYQHFNRPELIVDTFFHALIEDDLDLAKELATPTARKHIDEWKVASQHQAFQCPWGNLIEPYAGGLGPNITYSGDNRATSDGVAYSCHYGERNSMSIWGIELEYTGHEWLVTDWEEICESSISLREVCYQ